MHNINYIDITDEWIDKSNPKSHKIKKLNYWIHDGVKYIVDNKKVLFDYDKNEEECAKWLENTFGGELYICPRINDPPGISTPDFIFKNECWDLKKLYGNSKRIIDNVLKNKQRQSKNFIIDIYNTSLSVNQILKQVNEIYNSKDRKWIDKIIIKNNAELIKIYKRKRD